jgi:hypothetical protein
MVYHVGQDFLQDAKEANEGGAVEFPLRTIDRKRTSDPRLKLKLFHLPLNGCKQSELIQDTET